MCTTFNTRFNRVLPADTYEIWKFIPIIFVSDIREKYMIDELIADNGYNYKLKNKVYDSKHAAQLAYSVPVINLKRMVAV